MTDDMVRRGTQIWLDGTAWTITSQTRAALDATDAGTWLITTNGTTHCWDLDHGRYLRCPGPSARAGSMPFDNLMVRITRVGRYPTVGGTSLVWFDDPTRMGPALNECYRQSSTVQTIQKLEKYTGDR